MISYFLLGLILPILCHWIPSLLLLVSVYPMIAATKTWLGSPFCWLLHIIVSPSYLRLLRPFIYICIYIYVYHSQLQTLKPPKQQCRDASRSYRSSRRRFLSRLKTSPSEHWHLKIMGDSCVQRLSAILFVSLRGLNPIMGFPRFPPRCGPQPFETNTILVWQFQKTMGSLGIGNVVMVTILTCQESEAFSQERLWSWVKSY